MVKLFFSHVCSDTSHPLLDWISERLRKDRRPLEPFVACKSRDWSDARDLNAHLVESQFFIAVVTDEYAQRPNCTTELAIARGQRESSGHFPIVLPLKFKCSRAAIEELGFRIDQEKGRGERWVDFSESKDWEISYEEFLERVSRAALEHRLLGDDDFYKDCEHLDLVLTRDKPTDFEIKMTVELCGKGPEYASYFFRKLDRKVWLHHLKPFQFFRTNPAPVESPEQAGLFKIPHWPVLDYLETVSTQCQNPEDRQYAEELMQIMRQVTRPRDGEKADNSRTWWYFTKIMANLPTDMITLADIELVSDWLDSRFKTTLVDAELGRSLLPKFLNSPRPEDWKKAAKLVEITTRITWVERKYGEGNVERKPYSAVGDYWLRELFRANREALGEKCGLEMVELLRGRLSEVLSPDKGGLYSYIWRPAIEDHTQNLSVDRVQDTLISALRDILLVCAKTKGGEAEAILRSLLQDDLPILKRNGLYVVNQLYDLHQGLFWEVLGPELFDINLQHELFDLLQVHFRHFKGDEQDRVIDTIAQLTKDWKEGTDKNLLDAQLRLDWLQAISGQGNDRADELYVEYLKIARRPSDHPEFPSYTEGGLGEVRPCSVEDLLTKSVPEIVEYLSSFEGKRGWRTPSEEGLAEVLADAVKQKPDKFDTELSSFLGIKVTYQYAILRAFEDLWNGKKRINWGKILEFCLSIITPEEFWVANAESEHSGMRPTPSWLTSTISGLIEIGVKNDEWAFEDKYLPLAEEIILRILEKEPPTAATTDRDALTRAMNTARGRCLLTLLNYCLRQARLYGKRKKDRSAFWRHIQFVFDRELDRCKTTNLEFSAIAGAHLPNLWYLSKSWVEVNFDRIFSIDYEINWRCAMQGYAYVNRVYVELYSLLRQGGHLKRALETPFEDRHVREKLIQNIAIAYLEGWENLTTEDSLFLAVLNEWRPDDISEIISFFWMQRDRNLGDKGLGHILEFWRWCHEKIGGNQEHNSGVLSSLSLLTVFLRELSGESKAWLLQCAPWVDEKHHSPFFLEYLDQLATDYPRETGEIYLKMLERTAPTYPGEKVRSIVEKLYLAGVEDKAKAICVEYGRKGNPEFLRDLYGRYSSQR